MRTDKRFGREAKNDVLFFMFGKDKDDKAFESLQWLMRNADGQAKYKAKFEKLLGKGRSDDPLRGLDKALKAVLKRVKDDRPDLYKQGLQELTKLRASLANDSLVITTLPK